MGSRRMEAAVQVIGTACGAVTGLVIGGPVGAVFGAVIGALPGAWLSLRGHEHEDLAHRVDAIITDLEAGRAAAQDDRDKREIEELFGRLDRMHERFRNDQD